VTGVPLELERQYFESHKADLLERYRNQYVLIKGSELVGAFPDAETAYTTGLDRFGLVEFLVKQVLDEEPVVILPMLPTMSRHAGL
jgi:hypothetical protein